MSTTDEVQKRQRDAKRAGAFLLIVIFAILAGVAVGSTLTARDLSGTAKNTAATAKDTSATAKAAAAELRSQGQRLALRGNTIADLTDTVKILSEQRFAKCRADRTKFEKILDANESTQFAAFILQVVATPAGTRVDAYPPAQEALAAWLVANNTYKLAVNAPDSCRAL